MKGPNQRTPNDQRSDALNPTTAEHQAALDNRAAQLDPKNPVYHASRSGGNTK
jgi:hypothetical protein